jgi:hypothetical protein
MVAEDEDFHPQHFRVKRLLENVGQFPYGKVGTAPLLQRLFAVTNLVETSQVAHS